MSRPRRPAPGMTVPACAAVVVLVAGGLAGCSRDEPTPPAPSTTTATTTTATTPTATVPGKAPLLVNAVEPARNLLPANIGDEYGRRIGSLLYRGLLRYDEKGRLVNEVAEDVAQDGPLLYRVKVRKGWVFANGEPVTAASFVDAWNFAATPGCGQLRTDAFTAIAGYAPLHGRPEPVAPATTGTATSGAAGTTATAGPTTGATAPTPPTTTAAAPAASTTAGSGGVAATAGCGASGPARLAGLQVVDELGFTIRLAVPDATFRDRLATLPYAPLPRAAFDSPTAFAAAPVGNGPYQLTGGWFDGKEVRLIPNASYSGGEPAHNGGITFRFFADPSMTYPALLGGQLELLDDTPVTALDRYKTDLGFRAANQPVGAAASLVFPMTSPEWATREGLLLRRAISRSIDRDALASGLYAGTRSAATDLTAPGVAGYTPDLCGDTCRYDPRAAAALLPTRSPVTALTIAYGADAGGRPAVEAICSAITAALGLSCEPLATPRQADLELTAARHQLTVPMLSVRRMAHPDLSGFLSPRFLAGSSDNPSGYAGAAAQTLLARAAATSDGDARAATYRDAESAILADLPEIPLWYVNSTAGSGSHMEPPKIDVFGVPIYTELNRS